MATPEFETQEAYDAWHDKHVCVNCGGQTETLTAHHMCLDCESANYGKQVSH